MFFCNLIGCAFTFAPHLVWASKSCPQLIAKLGIEQHLPSSVASWAVSERTTITPIKSEFLRELETNGATIVTLGGSSISSIVPGMNASAKIYFKKSPETLDELVKMLADSAEPSLKAMAVGGKFNNGQAPIMVIPAPGLVLDNRSITLPGNFGKLAGQKVNLAELVPNELALRAERLGIPKEQLLKTQVHVDNDALPIVADAAIKMLKANEHATIVFAGTGTGAAKVTTTGSKAFAMQALEEGHLYLDQFPTVSKKVPEHISLGSKIAQGKTGSYQTTRLELENISGGGRVTDSATGARSHLGGANTVALNYIFLKPEKLPVWIRSKGGNAAELKKTFLNSLGFQDETALVKLIESSPGDRALFEQVKKKGSLGTFEIYKAAQQGSVVAQRMIRDNTYTQGLASGVIALNVGPTPAGVPVEAAWVYGKPKAGKYEVKLLARASDGMNSWAGEDFKAAKQGVEDAKNMLLKDPAYLAQLQKQGYALLPEQVKVSVEKIIPEADLHPDFSGLDVFSKQLRKASE